MWIVVMLSDSIDCIINFLRFNDNCSLCESSIIFSLLPNGKNECVHLIFNSQHSIDTDDNCTPSDVHVHLSIVRP